MTDEQGGEATVRRIEAEGGRAAYVRADVGVEEDVRHMIAFAQETFGGLDILVNNAGVTLEHLDFPKVRSERWSRLIDVNLRGVISATQLAAEVMGNRRRRPHCQHRVVGRHRLGAQPLPCLRGEQSRRRALYRRPGVPTGAIQR
ncbi:MAG TPA: SDR family NAD(P)-dependent oxidoreductase [Dehalococcoidia bacterium]|nr:SDR family NAD(P)-dependent oxidoreductase [Dehalococcoidia bacterium]